MLFNFDFTDPSLTLKLYIPKKEYQSIQTDNGGINIETEQKPTNAVVKSTVDNGNIDIFGKSDKTYVFDDEEKLIKLDTKNGSIKIK
jgi:hypothetical protein